MSEKRISATHQLVLIAMLAAAQVVLARFLSIPMWNLRIGFSFVPLVLAAVLMGAIPAAVTAAIADLIGATLFPSGPFFPGFTLTAAVTGFLYGVFLHKKQTMPHIVGAVLTTELLCSILMNTVWISMLYGTPYIALLPTRVPHAVGMTIVEIVVIRLLVTYIPHLKR